MQSIDAAMSTTFQKTRDRRAADHERMRAANLDLLKAARDEPESIARTCEHCGTQLLPEVVAQPLPWDAGHERVRWPACSCAGVAQAVEQEQAGEEARRETAKREAYQKRLERAGLVGWLEDARLDTFQPREEWPGAVQCRETVDKYREAVLARTLENPWLILVGEYGTGKSHLAAAVVRACVDEGWRSVHFRSWLAILERLKASYDREQRAEWTADIQRELREACLLVLDDLDKRETGVQSSGADRLAWPREQLYPILNHRDIHGLPTILTFNTPLDARDRVADRLALEEHIGRAVFDRIIGNTFAVVDFNGPSYRSGARWTQHDGTGGGV